MEYKKYNCSSYNVYTIKNDKFKTCHLEVIFRNVANKKDVYKYSFLADMLCESCKNYPRKKDLITKYEELYKVFIYAQTVRVGKVLALHVSLDFINPSFINEDNYLDNVIKLLFDMIDKPNVTNNEFDLTTFNIVKRRIKREIESLKENPTKQSIKEALRMLDEDSPTSIELLGDLESLEEITPSNLYETYQNLRNNFAVDIFVSGNIDMDNLVNIINKNFNNRIITEFNDTYLVENKTTNKAKVKENDSDNVQANLVMLYNLCNLSEEEKNITLNVFNYIFGSGGLNSKLYRSIREESSLCYQISSMYLKYDSLLCVVTSLDNENVDKAKSLINKCLLEMQKGDFLDSEVSDAINNISISLDMTGDNNVALVNNYVFSIYDNLPLLEERKKLVKNVTKKDIINVSKKIKLNTIFTLKGKIK